MQAVCFSNLYPGDPGRTSMLVYGKREMLQFASKTVTQVTGIAPLFAKNCLLRNQKFLDPLIPLGGLIVPFLPLAFSRSQPVRVER